MKSIYKIAVIAVALTACKSETNEFAANKKSQSDSVATEQGDFNHVAEQFADLRVLRYEVPGFDQLDLKTKTLLYYLSEAALCGRDINYDQNYKYNLAVRKTLEAILLTKKEGLNQDEYTKLHTYAKRVWFSNGIHHHYGHDKLIPECSQAFFKQALQGVEDSNLPLQKGQSKADFISFITPIIFDPAIAPKKVVLDAGVDLVQASAVNFYEGVTQKEATAFYESQVNKGSDQKPMYGLNTKLVKENGKLSEKVWMVGGMYSPAIEKIVYWLEKASGVAENQAQKSAIDHLITFYKSGKLVDFDTYNLAWIKDTASAVDVVNGFIEVYQDPLGKKGSFESVVSIKDFEASKRIAKIGAYAQWFEDNSPILPQNKKKNVVGISAKVINAVMEAGDAAPSTPIGINLPNSDWIREIGSKSVNLGNIVEAYEKAAGGGVVKEFYYTDDVQKRMTDCGALADKLHTDMHEVIGHASGKIDTLIGQPSETLKSYASALEEGRADLVALYYLMDPKLIELGVMPSLDYGRAAYDDYITNGMIVQLARIKPGKDIEEAHMRNRKMVSAWVIEKGAKENVVEKTVSQGKTYYKINNYEKLRVLFGDLLREIQRIKSQGDYNAGMALIENYGVKVDPILHKEVLDRYAKLKIAPYAGFIQPKLVPVMEGDQIKNVRIEYPSDFTGQMLEYGVKYGLLPAYN